MKDIVNLQCYIFSPGGKLVTLGDTVIVELPEMDRTNGVGDMVYWVSARTITARLGLRLSRGLVLHVLSIKGGDDDDDSNMIVGSVIQFKRRAWKWDLYE